MKSKFLIEVSFFLLLTVFASFIAVGDVQADNLTGDFQDFPSTQAYSIWLNDSGNNYRTSASPPSVQSALDDIANGNIASPAVAGPYLKITQTASAPQTVINDAPIFQEGISVGDGNKTIKKIDENTVGLYVNGELIMAWNNSPDSGGAMGVMCLTYA